MIPFRTLTSPACVLPLENIDTDQLIPARFMSRPRSEGYGAFLLHDLRKSAGPASVIETQATRGAQILIAGQNFGVGSSREAAVYALWDFGFRCVIAPSFGDIFAGNATKNGLLTAVIDAADLARLQAFLQRNPTISLTIDLPHEAITGDGLRMPFAIDPVRKLRLLNGWDDYDLTQQHSEAIKTFKRDHHARVPWAVPPTI
jgi:3-isopropylmalate/(R)-2-methylmalate dehydratase small subunit